MVMSEPDHMAICPIFVVTFFYKAKNVNLLVELEEKSENHQITWINCLWTISVESFTAIHPDIVEILQFGPKW